LYWSKQQLGLEQTTAWTGANNSLDWSKQQLVLEQTIAWIGGETTHDRKKCVAKNLKKAFSHPPDLSPNK
jgi:hypothetical protein